MGLSAGAVQKRVERRTLHRVHRAVYAVGRPGLTQRGLWAAAVLAYAPGAVLSHRDAAALLGLRRNARTKVDVTVPRRARPQAGVEVHVSTTLAPEDVTSHQGIPCTSVARTLVDLGDVVNRRQVERAVEQAEILHAFDLGAVEDAIARAGRRRGPALLRCALDGLGEPALTDRALEERFLRICRKAGLPQPAVNEWIAMDGEEMKVDFLWRRERLIVETDGRETHGTKEAFERDRRRDQLLKLAGYEVVRFTWRQVAGEPEHVARVLGALLGR